MAVSARGKGFQAKFMLAGDRHVAQFNSRVEAEAWEAACRLAHAKGQPLPEARAAGSSTGAARVATLQDLLENVWENRWARLKSGPHLRMIGEIYVRFVGPRTPVEEAFEAVHIDRYVRYCETDRRASSGTVNRHLSAIHVLAEQAARLRLISHTPALRWQKERKGRLRYYEPHEVDAILALCKTWSLDRYHDLFMFLVDTGARLGEAQHLLWEDINGKSITFRDTKNGEDRTIVATPRVQEALSSINRTGKGPFSWLSKERGNLHRTLWPKIQTHLNLGSDGLIHTFRHTCASRLVQRGVDLYRVQRWMGHKSTTTTMRYAHLSPKHLEGLADVLAA
jgi:integrase